MASNFKIIREFRSKKPAQVVKETGISKQNVSLWDNGKGNPGHEFIDQLVKYFDLPQEVFYMKNLTNDYLEKTFSNGNGTPVPKASDNNAKPSKDDLYRDLVEANSEYRLVPKIILDKYEILSNREIESREDLLRRLLDQAQEMSATKQIIINEQKKLIAKYEEEIAGMVERLKLATTPEAAHKQL